MHSSNLKNLLTGTFIFRIKKEKKGTAKKESQVFIRALSGQEIENKDERKGSGEEKL